MKPTQEVEARSAERSPSKPPTPSPGPESGSPMDAQQLEEIFAALKVLLGTVEKLQKARQDVGDIKSLLGRLLDGELLSGEDLEQLKVGVGGLSRLVRSYGDYQMALEKAQPARELLDQVLKG